MEVSLLGVWCWFVICMAERASLLFGLAAFEKETESGWGHWSAGAVYSQWVFVCPAPLTTAIVFYPFNPWRSAVNKHICHWGFLPNVDTGQDVFTYHSPQSGFGWVWAEATLNQIYRMCSHKGGGCNGDGVEWITIKTIHLVRLMSTKSTISYQDSVLCFISFDGWSLVFTDSSKVKSKCC